MTNKKLKDALEGNESAEFDDVECIDDDLDEVAGGACNGFTCGYYKPNAD